MTTLRLRDCDLPPSALAALIGSAFAAPLSELAFHRCDVEDLAFTRSKRLGKLQRLILRGYGGAADLGTLYKRWDRS